MKLPIYIRPQEDMFQLVDTDAVTIAERLTFEDATALQAAITTLPATELEMAFPQAEFVKDISGEIMVIDTPDGMQPLSTTTGGLTALAYIASRAFPVWLDFFINAKASGVKLDLDKLNTIASERAVSSAKALLEELNK